ncbi:DUF6292 family protein [Streptomyces griseoviridis]
MADPHAPYAEAVMKALGNLHDPANSWTEYNSDDGEVMLMEIVITLDRARALAAGWARGVLILWNQVTGWGWAYMTDERGGNSNPDDLLLGPLVADPADVARAVQALLTKDGHEQLPLPAKERPGPDAPLTPELTQAVGSGGDGDRDISPEGAAALAKYTS